MSRKSAIDTARSLLKRRQFNKAIVVLEAASDVYHESFDYYLLLGTACLYAGDTGNSNRYFQKARHIHLRNANLLLGQAALYLRRGDTDLAIKYYLEVLDLEPENVVAKNAMEFIRTQGNYENILKWVDTGRIEKFYPPVGRDYSELWKIGISVAAGLLLAAGIIHFVNHKKPFGSDQRSLPEELVLTTEELTLLQEKDLSGGVYRYILTDDQIKSSYESARNNFKNYHDNRARVEINRILNSNASSSVKNKTSLLLSYFEDMNFDSFESNPGENLNYSQVVAEPSLYVGCWVLWSGRITNALIQDDSYRCDLLLGYEDLNRVEGIIRIYFSSVPEIQGDKPVKILGKIAIEDGKLCLSGKSVYQPLRQGEEL